MPEIALSQTLLAPILRECAEHVLETMLFCEILGLKSSEDLLVWPLISASVSISGPLTGMFRIAASEPAATALATDFFGLDQPPGPASVQQVIGELANMICGSALSRIEPEALFTLGHPEPVFDPFPLGEAVQCFELAPGLLAVSIELSS
jgi:hypothetical protein